MDDATLVGAALTAHWLPATSSDWAWRSLRRAQSLALSANAFALVASLAGLWVLAMTMADLAPLPALAATGDIVASTQAGHAWAVGTAGLVLAAVLGTQACRHTSSPARSRLTQGMRLAALVLVAAAHAAAGHAGANGLGWPVAGMALHLLATAAWSGIVFASVLAVLRGNRLRGEPREARLATRAPPAQALSGNAERESRVRYVRHLSRTASWALAVVMLTGALAAWRGLGATPAALLAPAASLWTTTLDVKLALVAIAAGLGGFNRLRVLPRVEATSHGDDSQSSPAWRRFTAVLRIESLVLLAALVAAAILANGEPPAA